MLCISYDVYTYISSPHPLYGLNLGLFNILYTVFFIYLIHLLRCPFVYVRRLGQDKGEFKGAVSRDFRPLIFSWIESIWVPDKQAKMVFLKYSFSRRYSNSKFENFDSAQANTVRICFWICGHLDFWLRALLAYAESDSVQANTARSRIFRKYLRENNF